MEVQTHEGCHGEDSFTRHRLGSLPPRRGSLGGRATTDHIRMQGFKEGVLLLKTLSSLDAVNARSDVEWGAVSEGKLCFCQFESGVLTM